MKIIGKDNFDREFGSDILVCENVNEYYGKIIVDFLQQSFHGHYADYYYELVPDDYELYEFKP